jgi:hypothetical protein
MASDLAQYPIVDSTLSQCEANTVLYKAKINQLNLLLGEKDVEIGKWEQANANVNMRLSNKDIEINAKNQDIDRLAKKLKWQKVATKVAYGVAIAGVVATALYLSK